MTNDKQSSVDWLIGTMHRSAGLDQHQIDLIFEQAKAMHKEEMKQTYFDGWHRNTGNRDEDFEQYHNEIQGGNTNEQQ